MAENTESHPTETAMETPTTEDKPKPKQVPRPDRKAVEKSAQELNSNIEAINEEIAGIDKRIEEIKKQIDLANESRSDERDEVAKAREKRDEIRAELEAVRKDRDALQAQFEEIRGKVDSAIETSKSTKAQIRFRSVQEIDEEIVRLDRQQSTTSMKLADEKRIVKEIEQLKAQKRQLQTLGQSQEQITRDRDEKAQVAAALNAKRDEFKEIVERLNAQRSVLESLGKTDGDKKSQIPPLIEERKSLYDKKKEAVSRIREVQKQIKEIWDDFKARKKEWELWIEEERRQRDAEKKAKQEEYLRRQEEEEMKKIPYEEEMALCDYLMHYLKTTFLTEGHSAGGAEEAKNEVAPAGSDLDHNGKVLKAFNREEEDDDPFVRKKKGGAKKGKAKTKDQTIVHSPDTLASFALIQLTAPTRVSAVAGSIDELREKKAWYSVQPRPARKPVAEKVKEKENTEDEKREQKPKKKTQEEFRSSDEDFPVLGGGKQAAPAAVNGTASASHADEAPAAEEQPAESS